LSRDLSHHPTVATGRVLTVNQANTTATRTFPDLSGLTKTPGDLLIAICVVYQSARRLVPCSRAGQAAG
jgi:hypothetical protein